MRSDRDQRANLRRVVRPEGASTALLPASLIPRPGDGTSENRNRPAGQSCSNPMCFFVLLCGDRRLLAPAELGAVDPHAMEHGPELARQRDLRPLQAAALGDVHRPALEGGEARQPAQYHIGRLVQGGAHHSVAYLADPANHIRLAGLVPLGREPEMGPDRLGGSEPARVIHRRPEGDRYQRADPRYSTRKARLSAAPWFRKENCARTIETIATDANPPAPAKH